NRAVPWSQLIVKDGTMIRDLNLTMSHRISAGLVYLLILSVPFLPLNYWFAGLIILSLCGILVLNRRFYVFFWKHRGPGFVLKSFPLPLLHYTYSAAAFAMCWTMHFLRRLRSNIAVSWSVPR